MDKTALIIAYYGKIPEFIHLFLGSCKYNTNFDFLFFTDWEVKDLPKYENVKYISSSLSHFISLANDKLKLNNSLKIDFAYKLCDLKPAWPHIFEDFTTDYDFVGYCDIDLIFGNISHYFTTKIREKCDLFTITTNYLSGALTIMRNCEVMKLFYRKANGWEFIFKDSRHWAFDESLRIDESKEDDFNRLGLESFSDCVFARKNEINVINDTYIAYESRPGIVNIKNGRVTDGTGKEYVFFHFVGAKQCPFWTLPKWDNLPIDFFINKYGFYLYNEKPLRFIDLLTKSNLRKQVYDGCRKKTETIKKLIVKCDLKKVLFIAKRYL